METNDGVENWYDDIEGDPDILENQDDGDVQDDNGDNSVYRI